MEPTEAVKLLVDMAGRALIKYKKQIEGADDKVASLKKKLVLFENELKVSAYIHGKNEALRGASREIRTAVYEMEDAIDAFVAQTSRSNSKNTWGRFWRSPRKFTNAAQHVEAITQKVEDVMKELTQHAAWGWGAQNLEQIIKTPPTMSKDKRMVGFEQEMKTIISRLNKETEELDIIGIVGMPGLGKTTLAYKVFKHPEVESVFDHQSNSSKITSVGNQSKCCRIWVNVSPDYRKKDLLLSILSNCMEVTDEMRRMTDQEISEMVWDLLGKLDKFLIVLDDVWGAKAWCDLEGAFPRVHKAGKILITTQHDEVAGCFDRIRDPHKLRLLTLEESSELLKSEAFQDGKCPKELEAQVKIIANKCNRLPLSLVMIGNILRKRCLHGGMREHQHTWEQAADNLRSCLKDEDFQNCNTSFYDKLPYHLRPCFLYVGMFPEEYEIPARTLTRLWIAEGFVHNEVNESLEQAATKYLYELVDRNLVMIDKTGPDGRIKTCRVHYMLREFCRMEASSKRENVFQEMKHSTGGDDAELSDLEKLRRLCIYSDVNGFLSSNKSYPLVRSLMCFSRAGLQPADISSIPRVLKVLRVLEAKPITFRELPDDWNKLALLRHVVLSSDFQIIPKVLSKLQNMQTLIVDTKSRTLEIKANIWKMSKLRHVETNVSTKLPNPKKVKEGNNELQTLGMISHESCTEEVFGRLQSLRKLGICGPLDTIVKAKGLGKLEKLKLVNDPLSASSTSQGGSQLLPNPYEFPKNLTRLTLCATELEWSQMSRLGNLDKLEVLKLKNNAFKGDHWKARPGGFHGLQVLHIECNDVLIWEASANPFPELKCLTLCDCPRLDEIPLSLSMGMHLQKLHLKGNATDSAVTSARRIKEKKGSVLELWLAGSLAC